MNPLLRDIDIEINRLTTKLLQQQQQDGSWHFCFENNTTIDSYVIILFRTLDVQNNDIIRKLHDRILAAQQEDGGWRLYRDEIEGNPSASIDAYYALLFSGYSQSTDEAILRAERYIRSKGGIASTTSILSKAILAATGQRKWPLSISSIPLEVLLFPSSFPINIFDFSGYARVHLVPMLIMASKNFSIRTDNTPDLSAIILNRASDSDIDESSEHLTVEHQEMMGNMRSGLNRLLGASGYIHEVATKKAEQFMLDRIESDGTLYSYASSTIVMVFALLSLGYNNDHPLIAQAVEGLTNMQWRTNDYTTIQNSPSTIWDTALITYALQQSGTPHEQVSIQNATSYLINKQHTKRGDWSKHNPNTAPGGWGFSATNTINPDVDDTTAALRAIKGFRQVDPSSKESWNRGLNWVLSMQNKDGGWPAFEKNTTNRMLTWLSIDGAKSAAIDPSEADLTGRTLEYLGNFAGLDIQHSYIKRGADWLFHNQEKDGSWYGRWGICYIYGTWAAITGLKSVGIHSNHTSIQKATKWLLSIQNADGGFGESCRSDRQQHYVALGESTPSQTAWALDALISIYPRPTVNINRGIERLIASLHRENWTTTYPTGAGLPGNFYVHYHSYRYIWPLLTLGNYRRKYGSSGG
ncbi:squalene--hopene cyclase [Paenibacillus sp. GSMTC-2017]|uniref:squalene--hopene cyclase n=1 Tax=Paenibacillus sp. GSMTC-2017 TaxID=2794350 RepID=UPI0018D88FBA|nr:squalene--hopene cyclase [Paenibacillus sp. GSMTC-2017]MBH5318299.1 squalene--hopene cyclase [Paenibacillus sp. GSMTC-2017]